MQKGGVECEKREISVEGGKLSAEGEGFIVEGRS